jgi:hypothetical protein
VNDSSGMSENRYHRYKKHKLTKEEELRVKELRKMMEADRKSGRVNANLSLELIYLGFLQYVGNRKKVQNDLGELKGSLMKCADMMMNIMKKSEKNSTD